ncbi:pirin family protein [Thalassotalea profundi]|uniref:Pirin family protein n=1 Tax=Thalassotalea profundi TaxID=2036687 RepID=A0ABQ3IZD7_9GAMM|nr:pirin family protein [Thalassotalea profundi]GHE97650.1 hypothetical protein GCM10011501_29100 [Thalassotalea profundi]
MAITRELIAITKGMAASDGAGVKLTRLIGSPDLNLLDPFLLLDSFESSSADDYLAGFPPHPHRGFETVTYMLEGKMRHKDSAGNEGVISNGGVQWMTAGSGIIHSEMPEQESGMMQGFQLWVNLPKVAKMSAPNYQEYDAKDIAHEKSSSGSIVKVIAGITDNATQGVIKNDYVRPSYMDVDLPISEMFTQTVLAEENSLVYVISGEVLIGEKQKKLSAKHLGVLSKGEKVLVIASQQARFIFLSALPLNEPIARGGPFVMNTQAEVEQAFSDYRNNCFIK